MNAPSSGLHDPPAADSRTPRAGCFRGILAVATVVAVVVWHFCLVLYPPFHEFCRPELLRQMGLDRPSLLSLHEFLSTHFVPLTLLVGAGLAALLVVLEWKGRWGWARILPLAAAVALALNATLIEGRGPECLRRVIFIDGLLVAAALLYLVQRASLVFNGHFPARPTVSVLLVIGIAALSFYALRELGGASGEGDFGSRCAYFVLLGLLVGGLRGLAEPVLWSKSSSPALKVLLGLLLTDVCAPVLMMSVLPRHLVSLYPDLDAHLWIQTYFDDLMLAVCASLVTYDLAALRWAPGGVEVFGERFPTLESGALLPLVPVDRWLARRSLPALCRFFLAWTVVYGGALAVLAYLYAGGFLLYLLAPALPLVCFHLFAVFVSQALFMLSTRRRPVSDSIPFARSLAVSGALALAVVVFPALPSADAWNGMFADRGTIEKSVRATFSRFANGDDGAGYERRIRGVKRFFHRYEIVETGEDSELTGFNVLLITSDALRAKNLGCHGYHRETSPRIDALARESTRFAHAYAPMTYTSASIRSFLRGGLNPDPLEDLEGTWLKALVDAEVFEQLVIYGSDYACIPAAASESIRLVEDFELDQRDAFRGDLRSLKDRRFFVWVHNRGTHVEYVFRPDAKNFGWRQQDLYDNNVNHLDGFVGYALDTLSDLGLRGKTIVILSSDHGEMMNEHGLWGHLNPRLYDEVIHIPLIVHIPGRPAGVQRDYASLSDLGPTLVELFGYRVDSMPDWIRSHRDTLLGRRDSIGERLLPAVTWEYGGVGILRSDGRKFFLTRSGEYYFDHNLDPDENRNLRRDHPEAAAELRRACRRFFGLGERRARS